MCWFALHSRLDTFSDKTANLLKVAPLFNKKIRYKIHSILFEVHTGGCGGRMEPIAWQLSRRQRISTSLSNLA